MGVFVKILDLVSDNGINILVPCPSQVFTTHLKIGHP